MAMQEQGLKVSVHGAAELGKAATLKMPKKCKLKIALRFATLISVIEFCYL